MSIYSTKEQVYVFNCDFKNEIKVSNLVQLTQKFAAQHCISLGIDDEFYKKIGATFLLAQTNIEVLKPINSEDVLILETEASDPVRAIYSRYTNVKNGNDDVARVETRCILVDINTKKILRKPPENFPDVFNKEPVPSLDLSINKADISFNVSDIANYSRCDINKHLNNTYYLDMICDAFPYEYLKTHSVKNLSINYRSEIQIGTKVNVSVGEISENKYYVVASSDNVKKHFEANIEFINN